MPRATILLAEDDPSVLLAVGDALEAAGYAVLRATSGKETLALLRIHGEAAHPEDAPSQGGIDLLITDLWMPGIDGLALLTETKRAWPSVEVLLITGNATVPSAVRAMKAGAFDYLTKPFTPPELLDVVTRALDHRRLAIPNTPTALQATRSSQFAAPPPRSLPSSSYLRQLLEGSPSLTAIADTLRRAAPFKSTVLVTGESGTGKELVVRALHDLSPRRSGPFVAFNCAAVPATLMESELFGHEKGAFTGAHARSAGYFEAAHGGTLFIDEVGELEPGLQAKLLRALETGTITPVGSPREKTVDVRVIAATNADLRLAVDEKRFRDDLYYRLHVVHIDLPPLRDRLQDLPALVAALLARLCREHKLPVPRVDPSALAALARYRWPGNVRELRNLLESLLILHPAPVLTASILPAPFRSFPSGSEAPASPPSPLTHLEEAERSTIARALQSTAGDRPRAAETLGISLRTLYRKMARYGLR
jgi:DNA-binding NtrC family response regulator